MLPEIEPTAAGELRSTPISHLLVYALDHRLTGALFLTEPSGVTHTIRLARGVPVKVRPGDDHARLGELLVAAGVLTEDLLSGALAAKGLLGDVLVLAGKIEPERLEELLEEQFRARMVRLFGLGEATAYRYFDGHCELVDWGGDPASVDPLELIWSGLRQHAHASSKFDEVIDKVGDTELLLHPASVVDRMGLDEPEQAVADLLFDKPRSLQELADWELLAHGELEAFVYALLITRQIDVGAGTVPVGADLRHGVTTPPGGNRLGRVRLRSATHRLGAAAPDPPGDGERAPVATPSRRRRSGAASDPADEPPISEVAPALDPRPPSSGVSERSAAIPSTQPSPGARTSEAAIVEAPAPALVPAAEAELVVEPAAAAPLDVVSPPTASVSALVQGAVQDLRDRDAGAALTKCQAALESDPTHADAIALAAQARSLLPGCDVKALVLDLDDLLQRDDKHVHARFVRAQLRRRLSDDAGALRDLERVLEVLPEHADAARERAALVARQPREKAGLLSRLLRR